MAKSSLRVGVVLSSRTQPAWVCRVLEHIAAAHELSAVTIAGAAPHREPLIARLFSRVDDAMFGRGRDGLTACDATQLLARAPLRDAIGDADADVVLAFAGVPVEHREVWRADQDGLWEFATHQPVMRSVLTSAGRAIATTSGMPDAISRRRATSRLAWRTAAMIEHELDRRARGATRTIGEAPRRERPRVGNVRMLRRAAASARGWLARKYRDRFTREQWGIAFAFGSPGEFDPARVHTIGPPDDRLWADPFVIAEGGRAWIFIEEMLFAEGRGVISVLEVRRDGSWSAPQRILERPYHLSYPCVFRWNGAYYMLPETEGNGTIELYRCAEFPLRWELERVLMTDVHAVDNTVFEARGRWWMYSATGSGDAAGFDRLSLFHAATPLGPWTPHPWNPLQCDVSGGRPGGRPFLHQGKLVRATQVGAPWYGHSIQLREIVTLTPEEWEERDVRTIRPDWRPGLSGTHTMNVDGDVTVVDWMRFLRR